MTETHNPYLTTLEAADYLRLSRQFLEIARHRGNGPPYIKLSRAVRGEFVLTRRPGVRKGHRNAFPK